MTITKKLLFCCIYNLHSNRPSTRLPFSRKNFWNISYMGKEYTRNKNQKIYHIEKLIYRKKNRTLCSLWILEGNKCYLRLLIVTAPAYHKTGVTISKEKPEWKKESTSYTNHCISTYSISPQEKKSFLISRGEAHEERLLTLTFLICGKNTTKNFHGSFSYHSHIFMNCLAASSH